jgi:hypothetical protein
MKDNTQDKNIEQKSSAKKKRQSKNKIALSICLQQRNIYNNENREQ